MSRTIWITIPLFCVGALVFASLANAQSLAVPTESGPIKSVTAITEVFGTGQKLTAVALEYTPAIEGSGLSPANFSVAERSVTGVYTASAPDPAAQSEIGHYVILTLSRDDPSASLKIPGRQGGNPPPAPTGPVSTEAAPARTLGAGGPKGPMFHKPAAVVTQLTGLIATDGVLIAPPAGPVTTSRINNLIVDDFLQFEFRDPETGDTLKYNLYIPKGYDKRKTYPLVLFMHDASEIGADVTTTLQQGRGAVVWASPEEQAKHPAFVLAPAYPTPMFINSTYATSLLDTTVHLLTQVQHEYAIDPNRIYTTGQSAGAMMSLAIDIKYPDLFAASYIVAGQWNPELVKPLASQKLWVVVSEGDTKAYPTMNAVTEVLEREGTKVARAVWDGRWTPVQFAAAVSAMQVEEASVNYAVLRLGTVVPPGQPDNGGSNHMNTWPIAYDITGIHDWLFDQHR